MIGLSIPQDGVCVDLRARSLRPAVGVVETPHTPVLSPRVPEDSKRLFTKLTKKVILQQSLYLSPLLYDNIRRYLFISMLPTSILIFQLLCFKWPN